MPATALRRRARNPPIVASTQLVPLAAAREVLDEASRWLGVTLPSRYAIRLATQAHLVYANSRSFRRALARPGDAARDRLNAIYARLTPTPPHNPVAPMPAAPVVETATMVVPADAPPPLPPIEP